MPPDRSMQPHVAHGDVVREHLPLPVVHYPYSLGVFIGFAHDRRTSPLLCACARPAVANLFSLYPTLKSGAAPLHVLFLYFPIAVAHKLVAWNGQEPPPLAYQPGLCHRCNAVMPLLRYCDPGEGSDFMQAFGWYVNQAYLHFGMLPYGGISPATGYLPGSERELEAARAAEMAFQSECARLLELLYPEGQGAHVGDNGPRIPQPAQLGELLSLRKQASAARHDLKIRIEAIVRGQLHARG